MNSFDESNRFGGDKTRRAGAPPFAVPLVDSHLHLQEAVFEGDMDSVLEQIRQVGIRFLVCNGSSEADWPRVAALARQHREIIPCFGLHPWYVGRRSMQWDRALEDRLTASPAGVGEIGLDRWIEPRDERAQEEVFRRQMALARQLNRPAMIHCLQAWGWLMEVLRSEQPPDAGFLIHAYGGSVELIKPLADLGAYFSFAGSVLREKKTRQREALKRIPRDRLLLETDAPDLMPPASSCSFVLRDERGRERNHPANLADILLGVAGHLGVAPARLAELLWENSRRFLADLLPEPSLPPL
ncbi:MAG TPA: TatD family hydrolase [Candidatus Paceibacterota bacterium]|nr:TatD family hydrolase [Candidatus Paceibacterota bacterium]